MARRNGALTNATQVSQTFHLPKTVALPPGGLIQATAAGEATLAKLVLSHVGDAKTVADLFCGVGPFALRLAERARVSAVAQDAWWAEVVAKAVLIGGHPPHDIAAFDALVVAIDDVGVAFCDPVLAAIPA